tara:strand:+ start:22947 stop:23537 length:591 start_codon:yes stop_codon:yes gene_type:complete
MKTLLIIDLQNDFLPGGSLEVRDGDKIVNPINELMESYDHIIATKDWHPKNHISFASNHQGLEVGQILEINGLSQILWPDHCIQNTFGSEFPKELNQKKIDKIIYKGSDKDIDSYSGFYDNSKNAPTELRDYLKSKGIQKIDCVGLTTEYCVKFTAIDSIREGIDTRVILKCTKGINKNDTRDAVEEMRNNKVIMI